MGKKSIILGVALAMGVALSVRDWQRWRYEETKNYGHGPGGAGELEEQARRRKWALYQNEAVGIRLRYPEGWEVKENSVSSGKREKVSVVRFGEGGGWRIDVGVEELKTGANLNEVVDREIKTLKGLGATLVGERQNLNTERVSAVILTWEEGGEKRQRGVTVGGGKIVVVDVRNDEAALVEALTSLGFI